MTTREISSPILSPHKRLKLENESSSDDESVEGPARPDDLEITPDPSTVNNQVDEDSDTEENCVICLQVIVDRTVIPTCLHDRFCFECLELWTAKSRKCPLCTSAVGAYIIHNHRCNHFGGQRMELEDPREERRKHNLYAKHVASNRYTKYKPYPSPSQFASSPDLISKATAFIRRELRVWPNLDIEVSHSSTEEAMRRLIFVSVFDDIHHLVDEVDRHKT
ncbi:hypothetical protein FRC02_010650 [Tulasnella sp. 418]|nr:hypothetical protein FRC02_010650 [Tulasnella sp. 418]